MTTIDSTLTELLAKVQEATMRTRTVHQPVTIAPHVMDALSDPNHPFHPTRQEATVNTTTEAVHDEHEEHDWDSYDSSDIHLRTQEWEAQERPTVIQHFIPKNRRLTITPTQLQQANAALEAVMPGVQLGADLRQHVAHRHLVEFLGADAANTIMSDR